MSEAGGRVFFSNVRRSLEFEDEIRLLSIGVDIGSSTSHLVFSRLLLERLDNRYIVAERVVLHESEVMLTPYEDDQSIDAPALRVFIDRQYALAQLTPAQIDSGALILTGVAVRRRNARAIADVFAAEAGKFVAVSAGDALETTLAAFGSGAAARSIREGVRVMNVDIGGGTSKIALCAGGAVVDLTALDVGARIVAFDGEGRVARVEAAGRRMAEAVGLDLTVGEVADPAGVERLVESMADRLFEALQGGAAVSAATAALLRLEPLGAAQQSGVVQSIGAAQPTGTAQSIGAAQQTGAAESLAPGSPPGALKAPDVVSFSGGVSEYIHGRETRSHGDLGQSLARAILERVQAWGPRIETADHGIRATVVGASQYTIQVSGSTIFVEPQATLPLRNLPVIAPALPLLGEVLDSEAIAAAVYRALQRMDLHTGAQAVALCYRWHGSATYARLDVFCRAVTAGLRATLDAGHPLVLVGDGDVGGLVGIHAHSELRLASPIVSIDGIVLDDFDFIDIGALLDTSGAVPVVIKSLVFPQSAALGRPEVAGRRDLAAA
ncbi:MAG: ethanolamine ammonia-lyase reactivating factor EutA [Pseudomonadota bacterium]|nr:ethanolamine ammonia-lyase reactivating factor EutA [Pseudomonadota bacterium]